MKGFCVNKALNEVMNVNSRSDNPSVKNYEKELHVRRTSYFWAFRSFHKCVSPLFQIKLNLLNIVLLSGITLRKAVPGKLHGSGGHIEGNCLQDQANFSQALVIMVNCSHF